MPITRSIVPSFRPATTRSDSFFDWKRDSAATVTGKPAYRSENVSKCCWTSRVVGTRTATCLPSWIALKAARTATSVFPYPTSPQMRRSMGTVFIMSALTSSIVVS